jgi:histidine ammonia-lyase
MGTISARQALDVVDNVEAILSVELLAAAQALEFLKPLKPAKPLIPVIAKIRKNIPPWVKDRNMSADILKMKKLIQAGSLSDL